MKNRKRKNIKRNNKVSLPRKVLKKMPALFAIIAVSYTGMLINAKYQEFELPTVLAVEEVHIDGELQFLDRQEIRALVRKNITGGYFTVDMDHIRQLLLDRPWIKDVSLRRQWPARLNVSIQEHKPVAFWNDDAYLNADGDVFRPEKVDTTLALPELSGPAGQSETVWKFMNVLYEETALLNYEVVRLSLDDRRAWQLRVAAQDGDARLVDVRLGRFDTKKRLHRFVYILPSLMAGYVAAEGDTSSQDIKVIDMRYPNGFAIQSANKKNSINNYSRNYVPRMFDEVARLSEA